MPPGRTAILPVPRRDGGTELRPTQVYIDEHTLRQVAQLTGGKYFRATDSEALRSIYEEINRLEKTPTVVEQYQQYVEFFPPFLWLAMVLLVTEIVLTTTRLRTIP